MPATHADDHYKVLGVHIACSGADIAKAYKKLALKHHPDKNPDDKHRAEEVFNKISEAYSILSDVTKRRQYDESRKGEGVFRPSQSGGAAAAGFPGGGLFVNTSHEQHPGWGPRPPSMPPPWTQGGGGLPTPPPPDPDLAAHPDARFLRPTSKQQPRRTRASRWDKSSSASAAADPVASARARPSAAPGLNPLPVQSPRTAQWSSGATHTDEDLEEESSEAHIDELLRRFGGEPAPKRPRAVQRPWTAQWSSGATHADEDLEEESSEAHIDELLRRFGGEPAPKRPRTVEQAECDPASAHNADGSAATFGDAGASSNNQAWIDANLSRWKHFRKRDLAQGHHAIEWMHVPRRIIGKLIGSGGKTMKKVEKQTGAVVSIQLSKSTPDPCPVRLLGTADAVQQAVINIWNLLYLEPPVQVDETIEVSSSKIGKVIGIKGAQIEKIQHQTGAKLDLVDLISKARGAKETYKVRLRGDELAVADAKALIFELTLDAMDEESEYIFLDRSLSGAVLGKGGSRLREIEALSGARVDIDKTKKDSCCVRVSGSAEQMQRGKELVLQASRMTGPNVKLVLPENSPAPTFRFFPVAAQRLFA